MSTEKINEIINRYFDNDLNKNEELFLFTQLSQNEEARKYFKEMSMLKNIIESAEEKYPIILDNKVFSQLKTESQILVKPKPIQQIFNYISYAVAIILLALSIFFYNESMQYRNKLELTYYQVKQQNEMIQVLFNTLPQIEVRENLENTIIVTPKM